MSYATSSSQPAFYFPIELDESQSGQTFVSEYWDWLSQRDRKFLMVVVELEEFVCDSDLLSEQVDETDSNAHPY